MSELRAAIVDASIEYVTCDNLVDELESALNWNDEADIGLCRAIVIARDEAADARRRLMGLVRILMKQEGSNV